MSHPIWGERDQVQFWHSEDGWIYTNIGYRFHGEYHKDSNVFKTVWDLEKWEAVK